MMTLWERPICRCDREAMNVRVTIDTWPGKCGECHGALQADIVQAGYVIAPWAPTATIDMCCGGGKAVRLGPTDFALSAESVTVKMKFSGYSQFVTSRRKPG